MLHRVVRENLETFLADARERLGTGYPRFVENEFRRYLECGLLPHGFARVRCESCGHDRLVAFSCKSRGVCPSCAGRRMSDTAAFLADHVLPIASYRQWTFSVPRWLRPRMVRDGQVLSRVLGVFLGTVFSWQQRRARAEGLSDPATGSVTFVQRFGSALNLHLHFHAVLPDGVFVHPAGDEAALAFTALPPPSDLDVTSLTDRLARRLTKLFSDHDERPLRDEEEALASSWAESSSSADWRRSFRRRAKTRSGSTVYSPAAHGTAPRSPRFSRRARHRPNPQPPRRPPPATAPESRVRENSCGPPFFGAYLHTTSWFALAATGPCG